MHLHFFRFQNVGREGGRRVKTPKFHLWCYGPAFDLRILHSKQTAISVLKKTIRKKNFEVNLGLGTLYFDVVVVSIYKTCWFRLNEPCWNKVLQKVIWVEERVTDGSRPATYLLLFIRISQLHHWLTISEKSFDCPFLFRLF